MQGRLSSPALGRLQAFPWQSWENEFDHARACGFDAIEWLFDAERYAENPLWTPVGRARIRERVDETSIAVPSVCADYFMWHPFFRAPDAERERSIEVLDRLVDAAAEVGIGAVLIPVLEMAEIRTADDQAALLESLREPADRAVERGVRLGLETELPASRYLELIEQADHGAVGAYYDTGNSAAAGHNVADALRRLAPYLVGVHLKDRPRGGPTQPLGQGGVDFDAVFTALEEVRYAGGVVIQSTSGADFVAAARAHLAFVRARIATARRAIP